jgi:hypothetical protein
LIHHVKKGGKGKIRDAIHTDLSQKDPFEDVLDPDPRKAWELSPRDTFVDGPSCVSLL